MLMKNNEYNKVKVTNEKGSAAEFVAVQGAETTFYVENKTTPYKDELNSRATNNDKIEEIGVGKNRKASAIKKEDYKKIKQGTVHLSSTAGHMVVAATTISVAVVGTMVGLDILTGLEEEQAELATFSDSEIGIDYVRFNFVVANQHLSYYDEGAGESPAGSDTFDLSMAVFATLTNENYYRKEEIVEYGPYEQDEDYTEFYGYIEPLAPKTSYELTLTLCFGNYEEVEDPATGDWNEEFVPVITKHLARRVFETKPVPTLVTFTLIDPSYNDVMIRFKVAKSTINYGEAMENSVFVELTNEEGYYDSYYVQSFRDEGGDTVSGEASFSNLSPSTKYTVSVKMSTETAYVTLGATTFSTLESNIGFHSITFSEYAHYTNHTFTVTLDFEDDSDNPRYRDYTLIWRDNVGNQIDVFYLQPVKTAQTVVVTQTNPGVYDYDLDGTFNYELTAMDNWTAGQAMTTTLATGGPVTFTNADVTTFNGFTDENQFLVNTREGNAEMLIQFDYVDEQLIYESFDITISCETIEDTTGDPITVEYIAYCAATTKWQYAEFNPVDPDNFKTLGELVDGSTQFDVVVGVTYDDNSTDSNIYSDTITPKISDDIIFYEAQFNSNQVSSSNYDFEVYFWYTFSYEVSLSSNYPQLVFVDRDNTDDEFVYYFYPDDYPSSEPVTFNLCQILEFPQGIEMGTYSDAKAAMDGKYFDVYIRWEVVQPGTPTGEQRSVLIDEGFYFNFVD